MAEVPNAGMELVKAIESSQEVAGGGRLLFTLLLDDSISIYRNHEHVVRGYAECLEVLRKAPGRVAVQTQFLNRKIPVQYLPPSDVVPLTAETYVLTGGTPLFVRTKEILETVLAESDSYPEDVTMTFIFTDGWDTKSREHGVGAADVKKLVVPMFESKRHIVGAFAVYDGHTDFRQVFADMGIPPQWIKVLDDWERVKTVMSGVGRVTSRASRSYGDFSEVTDNGY